MNILITGSNGLIGKTLCNYFKNTSIHVKKFDRNLSKTHVNYESIMSPEAIHFQLQGCDGVVHLGGVSRVTWGEKNPEYCWETNVVNTQYLLEVACTLSPKPWVIYSSSREVYGQQKQLPVTESAALQPLNVYARSKVAAEELVEQYRSRGLNTAILRFSSVYGRTDDHPDRVIPAFCRAVALGQPLRIEGGDNIFDFTHVSDVVDGIAKTIEQLQHNKSLPTIHLTTGQPTTLRQLAELVCRASNTQPELIEAFHRSFDVARFYGDSSLARKVLGWTFKTDITTGINQMVKAFQR